ncbi:MAG: hypothetical protein HC764_03145 [Pleurocapsa sp. CRU_1_2]|nr:hypothetical protein [Pleurocapsa sp. CRU_1_2]
MAIRLVVIALQIYVRTVTTYYLLPTTYYLLPTTYEPTKLCPNLTLYGYKSKKRSPLES